MWIHSETNTWHDKNIQLKHADVEKKLNDLSGEVKLILAKGLTKDLVNGCSILNGANYFSREDRTQNYLLF